MHIKPTDQSETNGLGTLPCTAPLAVPFVPFQKEGAARYDQNQALNQGTLFPGLNLPFHLAVTGTDVVNTPLAELQALEFVVQELVLYLDTHPEDQEAFELFQSYLALEREGHARYVAKFGPLTREDMANCDHYTWLKGPWPWEGGID